MVGVIGRSAVLPAAVAGHQGLDSWSRHADWPLLTPLTPTTAGGVAAAQLPAGQPAGADQRAEVRISSECPLRIAETICVDA